MFTKSKYPTLYAEITGRASELKRILLFAISFGGLKINALSAALLLSNFFTNLEGFGAFEYALSIGILLSVPLNQGLQGAIPYFLIKQKRNDYISAFYFHGLLVLGTFAVCFLLYILVKGWTVSILSLSISIAVIYSLQILASTISKTQGNIYHAIVLDGIFFIWLNAYNLYLFLNSTAAELPVIQGLLIIQILCLAVFYAYNFFKNNANIDWTKYRAALKFGRPIIIGSVFILVLTSSGRIFTANFLDLSSVAIYGVYFRLAAIVVMVHQIVNIAFFKKIYASKSSELDQWFEKFLLLILLLSAIAFFIMPVVAKQFFEMVRNSWAGSEQLFLALIFQMFYWITLSLFENIIARENLATAFNKRVIPILLLMTVVLGISFFLQILDLHLLIMINGICIYLAVEAQIKLLKNRGSLFPKTTFLLRLGAFLQFVIYLIQY